MNDKAKRLKKNSGKLAIKSNFASYITRVQASKVMANGGFKPTLREIECEIAEYTEMSREGIYSIKRGKAYPSIQVALKITEYLRQYFPNINVENIFYLADTPLEED